MLFRSLVYAPYFLAYTSGAGDAAGSGDGGTLTVDAAGPRPGVTP